MRQGEVSRDDPGVQAGLDEDVGAAASHVGGDGHGPVGSGALDDLGLRGAVDGIQKAVLDPVLSQKPAEPLRLLDGHSPDEDGPAYPAAEPDLAEKPGELPGRRAVEPRRQGDTPGWLGRGDAHD